jgi:hypothetical protein
MAPINPYLLRTAMQNSGYKTTVDTDMEKRRWCFVIDENHDHEQLFRAVFTSSIGNFNDKAKKFNKEEFHCLLLCCFQIMLEDMQNSVAFDAAERAQLLEISEDDIHELQTDDFRSIYDIFTKIQRLFFSAPDVPLYPSAEMQSILVPSLSHFCVYVAKNAHPDAHYVRMKIPEHRLEFNIMQVPNEPGLSEAEKAQKLVLECCLLEDAHEGATTVQDTFNFIEELIKFSLSMNLPKEKETAALNILKSVKHPALHPKLKAHGERAGTRQRRGELPKDNLEEEDEEVDNLEAKLRKAAEQLVAETPKPQAHEEGAEKPQEGNLVAEPKKAPEPKKAAENGVWDHMLLKPEGLVNLGALSLAVGPTEGALLPSTEHPPANIPRLFEACLKLIKNRFLSAAQVGHLRRKELRKFDVESTTTFRGPYSHSNSSDPVEWCIFYNKINSQVDGGMWHKHVEYMYLLHAQNGWQELIGYKEHEDHDMTVFVRNFAKYVLKLGNSGKDTRLTYTFEANSSKSETKDLKATETSLTSLKTWQLAFNENKLEINGITISYKGHEVPCNTVDLADAHAGVMI